MMLVWIVYFMFCVSSSSDTFCRIELQIGYILPLDLAMLKLLREAQFVLNKYCLLVIKYTN